MNTSAKPIRIGVIEDEPAIQDIYTFKLANSGFAVAAASNGLEGLELARSFKPALILLDLRMPILSGDEMLERLRATEWGASIRVIALTNISKDEAPRSLRFLAVDRYVVKAHHTPTQVVEIVREVLNLPRTP